MEKAREVFESLMRPKNKDLNWDAVGLKYTNQNIQTKWRYFCIGWMQRGVHNGA